MCHFVTIGFPAEYEHTVQNAIGYRLQESADPRLKSAFRATQTAFEVNTGHCACDRFNKPLEPEEIEATRMRYAKKGWTTAKIERTIIDRQRHGGLELELTRRIVNAARDVPGLSLLVIWDEGEATNYRGSVTASAEELVAKRWLIRAGVRVDIEV